MAHTIATTAHEVRYRPDHLLDVLKILICQPRRLIRVAMLSQSALKPALNRLHRYITKKLMVHFNDKWRANLRRILESGSSSRSSFWKFVKRLKIGGLHHYRPFEKKYSGRD
ncbi:hypothetical protein Zmor_012378 [Zophobas morio]|uniref:Uncharacterized protein n=1 Tax=Zophobas morio TaxID=2755281 RepID=A0AA38LZL5_9CUCU|nr:hypothetical protein Zmor_012378 [Zophobas morio]